MLTITIPDREMFDDQTNTFFTVKGQTLQMEHSLVSLSKWESKWHKPFLDTKNQKTMEETQDYFRCMTITQNVDPEIYKRIPSNIIDTINKYIDDPMTATTFSNQTKTGGGKSIVTSELIYYWMISYNIPMECQKWHLSRLLTLIRVCDAKNAPAKKMSKKDTINRYAELNAARRKQFNSKG